MPPRSRAFGDPVKALLHRVNEEVALLPDPVLRSFAPVLVSAQKELEKNLADVLSRLPRPGDPGWDERFTAQQLRNALVQVRGAVRAVEQAQRQLGVVLVKQSDVVSRAASRHLELELRKFSGRFEQSIAPLPILQAARISNTMLADQFQASALKWGQNVVRDVRLQISLGLVRGETVEQVAQRLLGRGNVRRYGEAPPQIQAQAASHRLFQKYEYEARRVVRTEVIYAYNAVKGDMIERMAEEDPGIMQRWDGALDERICPACRELDGVVVPVGQAFPGGYTAPPLHPFCRCAVVAWRKDWTEQAGARVSAGVPRPPGAPRPGGPLTSARPIARPTGSLKAPRTSPAKSIGQLKAPKATPPSAAQQVSVESILNDHELQLVDRETEKGLVFDRTGKLLHQLEGSVEGGRHEISLEGFDTGALKDSIFTHNHPGGTSLSADDGFNAVRYDKHSIRAVLRNANGDVEVHSLTRPSGGWPAIARVRDAYHDAEVAALQAVRDMEETGRVFTSKEARQFIRRESWERASKELGVEFRVARLDGAPRR